MDIIVTGGTSFIGLACIRQLLAAGHTVWAVVRPASSKLNLLPTSPNLHTVICSLEEMAQLPGRLALGGGMPPRFLHLAWGGTRSEARSDAELQQHNVECSLAALRAALKIGCDRFVFAGSQAEYGLCRGPMPETLPCRPVTQYGAAKLEFGRRAAKICETSGMEYLHCRIFSVYGPGDQAGSLVSSCLRAFTAGETISLGECAQPWNFLYIEDAAEALVRLLLAGGPTEGICNVASADTRPLREFVEEIYRCCGKRGGFIYGARPKEAAGPVWLMPDIARLEQLTCWRPSTPFSQGILETKSQFF